MLSLQIQIFFIVYIKPNTSLQIQIFFIVYIKPKHFAVNTNRSCQFGFAYLKPFHFHTSLLLSKPFLIILLTFFLPFFCSQVIICPNFFIFYFLFSFARMLILYSSFLLLKVVPTFFLLSFWC